MSTVIGDEDNGGWASATMVNGKMIEQDPKSAADSFNVPKDCGFGQCGMYGKCHDCGREPNKGPDKSAALKLNVPKPTLEELNANYPYPFKPHKCSEGGCAIPDYVLVDADTPEAKLVHPNWAPPVDRADPVHSGLVYGPSPTLTPEEVRKINESINPPSVTSTSPKSLDSSHKIPVNLCPASAIIAIAMVISLGHKKPGRSIYNWRTQPISLSEYLAAALRHLLKSNDGSNFDPELTKLAGVNIRHDWAAMSCLAIIEDARQAGTLVDDRPVKGGAEEFLESLMVKK
jgi:hypothetical protein